MTHRSKGVQVFVELPGALHHQGHWSWQQVLQELLGYPHLAVPGGKRAQTHSRSPGWTSPGLKADAGKGSCGCTMRSACPPTSSELWHKAERQRSIPGLKSTRLSRRQCPQRRDIHHEQNLQLFYRHTPKLWRRFLLPAGLPLRTSQGHRGNSAMLAQFSAAISALSTAEPGTR